MPPESGSESFHGSPNSIFALFRILDVTRLQIEPAFHAREIEVFDQGSITRKSVTSARIVSRKEEFPEVAGHGERKMRIVPFPIAGTGTTVMNPKTHF